MYCLSADANVFFSFSGKARLIDAELKSMCYKKGTDYCGDYINGKAGSAPWALMASHCKAPRDPWQRPLPSGTECSAACGTTMSRIASEWGCCLQSMAIANDRAFSQYLHRQAFSCGVTLPQPCPGGEPLKLTIYALNLKCAWVLQSMDNRAKVKSIVSAEIALFFGLIKSQVTVTPACTDTSNGTTLSSNMEFTTQSQSQYVKALFTSRRARVIDLPLESLNALLPFDAKVDPMAGTMYATVLLLGQLSHDELRIA